VCAPQSPFFLEKVDAAHTRSGPMIDNQHHDDDSFDVRTDAGAPIAPASVRSGEVAPAGFERIEMFLDVGLDVRVELGRASISIQKAMRLAEGSVIELDKIAGDPLNVVVNGRIVARGEAVVIGERLGVRIIEVVPAERTTRR
jgi:flagellar motor switch protein FliN/FliY